MSSEKKLCFMSWNSRGVRTKIQKVKSEIETNKCDVVFLQETHSGESEVLEKLEDWKSFYTKQTSNRAGVAILIKTNIIEETKCTIYCQIKDPACCYILVKCTLKGHLFTLVSVYNCPSCTTPLSKLVSVIEEHAEGILLIGGDFNVPLNPYLDRTSKTNNIGHLHLRRDVEDFMTSFHLVDVWRRLHPREIQYSFKQNDDIKSRLDYIFVPEESMQYIVLCEIAIKKGCSDHYPVVFEISIPKEEYHKPVQFLSNNRKRRNMKDKSIDYNHWMNVDLPVNPITQIMIKTIEVAKSVQSLIRKNVKRPDNLSVDFYRTYLHCLTERLCGFYHRILEKPTNIPKKFNARICVSSVSETHYYIFNVDYLILATIMAKWLYEHLQLHSTDYTDGDNKKTVLFTYKKSLIRVKWSVLYDLLVKEQDDKHMTVPPLLERFKITVLHKMLNESPSGRQKFLFWGCPLTPVLMTLYLKSVADEMIEKVNDSKASIHISRENVIVRFSVEFKQCLLLELKEKHKNVDCKTLCSIQLGQVHP